MLLRLIIVDLMPDKKRAPIILINPEMVAASDELATREEGCLSLPGQYADVTRPARVKVRFTDETGARREIEARGCCRPACSTKSTTSTACCSSITCPCSSAT